jgi:hypothetical protein
MLFKEKRLEICQNIWKSCFLRKTDLRGCEKIEIQSAFANFFTSFKISSIPTTARGTFREEINPNLFATINLFRPSKFEKNFGNTRKEHSQILAIQNKSLTLRKNSDVWTYK